jgi:hypothetical protein
MEVHFMNALRSAAPVLIVALLCAACSNDSTTEPGPDTTAGDTGGGDVAGGDGGGGDVAGDSAEDVGGDADTGDAGDVAGDADASDDGDAGGGVDGDASVIDVDDAADGEDVPDVVADADVAGDADAGTTDADAGGNDASDAGGGVDKVTTHKKACSKDGDCLIPCASAGSCVSGTCLYTAKANTCLVDLDKDQVGCFGAGMKQEGTPCLSCNPAVATAQLTAIQTLLPIDDDAHGLTIAELTAAAGALTWQLDDGRSVSGGKSLYFGDPGTKTYANDKHAHATATTKPLAVPSFAGVKGTLSFWLWLETEKSKGYDVLTVSAVEGEKATPVWTSDAIGGSTHGVWQLIHADVGAWAGKTVAFRFEFDTKDGFVNAFEGAYIDDISLRTGCCGSQSDCDDGNACSTDSCAPTSETAGQPVCAHKAKPDCCSSSGDCDDGKPCTLDLCPTAGGTCSHNAKPGCCLDSKDCDDDNACTIDHCPKAGSSCQHTDTCCKTDTECQSDESCLKGACTGGECTFTSTCCIADAECDDFNPCTVDACGNGKCAHTPSLLPGCCSPEPWVATFSSGLDGWTSDPPVKDLAWSGAPFPFDDDGKKGDGAAVLGIPGKSMSGVTGSNYVIMKSPDITLPPGQDMTFSFKVKFDLSYKSSSQNVTAYVYHEGKQTTLGSVTFATSGKDGWNEFTKDVSALSGQTFQIYLRGRVYGFGSGTSGTGIWVDDVKFSTSCNPLKCASNSQCPTVASCLSGICTDGACTYANSCCKSNDDCKSDNLCITSSCSGTKCSFSEKKGCCMGAGDCDDGNPCTVDICPSAGGDCQHSPVAGCCLSSSDCNDNDKCTDDLCIANKCKNNNLCCKVDGDCADGETKCTVDTCGSDGVCKHTQTGAQGCCEPFAINDDFEKGAGGWKFTNSGGPTKGWQVVGNALLSKSPKGALYYGDPAAGNYNWGTNNGQATSPSFLVPSGKKSELVFQLHMDTESGTTYDKLIVYVVDGGQKNTIWTKSSSGFGTKKWIEVKSDLSKYAGKSVQVLFDFNTTDSVANSTKGVFVDDFQVVVDCGS